MSEGRRERATAEHDTRYHFPLFLFESIVLYYHHEARNGTGDTRAGDCSLSRLAGLGWAGLGWDGMGKQDGLRRTYIYLMPTKGDTTSVSVTYYTYACTGDGCILHNIKQ